MLDEANLKKRLSKLLPDERYKHSINVEKTSRELALHHAVPENKAVIAGLFHDVGRSIEKDGYIKKALEFGLEIDDVERFEPKLLHSKIGAFIAGRDFNISDKDILNAIENHTTGREGMSELEKVVYLADHIEADRIYKGVDEVRSLAYINMDMAIIKSTTLMIQNLMEKGLPVHPKMLKARNFYTVRQNNKS